MARNKVLLNKRNEKVIARYSYWAKKTKHGRQCYNHSWILAQLCEEFLLTERTIESILTKKVITKPK